MFSLVYSKLVAFLLFCSQVTLRIILKLLLLLLEGVLLFAQIVYVILKGILKSPKDQRLKRKQVCNIPNYLLNYAA